MPVLDQEPAMLKELADQCQVGMRQQVRGQRWKQNKVSPIFLPVKSSVSLPAFPLLMKPLRTYFQLTATRQHRTLILPRPGAS